MHDPAFVRAILTSLGVTLVCAALLLATSGPLAMVWDEGDTISRAEAIASLPERAGVDGWGGAATLARREDNWPYTTRREGHPPLAGIVVAAGSRLAPDSLAPLTRYRLGPIALFSLGVGAMGYRLARDYRSWAVAFVAVAVLLSMPRLFAHAHFATLDAPLAACWLLAWAAFEPARRQKRWIAAFGLALGLTLASKFTGWLAPLPFAIWAIAYRDRGGLRALAVGVPMAIAVFVALNPPLWSHPIDGLRTFFDLNLHRDRAGLNISTQFFGRLYNLDYPLPWYNTLVWTAITVAPLCLVLGLVGIVATLRRWRGDRLSMLLVFQWATLVVVRAMPFSPPHDAERLILPSFAFFAALAGVGAGRALYRDSLLAGERIIAQGWAKVAIGLALAGALYDSVRFYPFGLSYYSRAIGGLRGAVYLGMEPTYYWDALDRGVIEWLAENTASNEKVYFAAYPPRNLELLKRWGFLERLPSEPGRFRWYVLQRRPSAHQPADAWLIAHAQPVYERTLFGVPLLDVYSFADYERAKGAVGRSGARADLGRAAGGLQVGFDLPCLLHALPRELCAFDRRVVEVVVRTNAVTLKVGQNLRCCLGMRIPSPKQLPLDLAVLSERMGDAACSQEVDGGVIGTVVSSTDRGTKTGRTAWGASGKPACKGNEVLALHCGRISRRK